MTQKEIKNQFNQQSKERAEIIRQAETAEAQASGRFRCERPNCFT